MANVLDRLVGPVDTLLNMYTETELDRMNDVLLTQDAEALKLRKELHDKLVLGRAFAILGKKEKRDIGAGFIAKFGSQKIKTARQAARIVTFLSQWNDELAQCILSMDTINTMYGIIRALDPEEPDAKAAAIAELEANGYHRLDREVVSNDVIYAWMMKSLLITV